MPDFKPLYRYSYNEACRLGQLDEWRESHDENIRCRDFIDRLISENYDGLYLRGDIAKKSIAEFGYDRTNWVLANTIQNMERDGRISQSNKAWASELYIPKNKDNTFNLDFLLKSHIGLIDMVARDAHKLYADLNLYDHRHCVPDSQSSYYSGKLMILRADMLKESCRTPENQLFFAETGFGCSPTASGRSVFGRFLIDGEKACFNRNDFVGEVDERYLADWAVQKLNELDAADAPEQEASGPTMKGL